MQSSLPLLLLAGLLDAVPATGAPARVDVPPAPNVVLVVLDDVGHGDFGCYGNEWIRTPHLDTVAAQGTVFTQYYACGAVCSPTRASILTGQYPLRFGILAALDSESKRGLPPEVPTLAERLRARGYATAHVGKWHLGNHRAEYLPERRGFEFVARFAGGYVDPAIKINHEERATRPGHLTEILTDIAIEYIRQPRETPFFLNLWYHTAHIPMQPPAAWAEQYEDSPEGQYAALVSNADEQIGRLVRALEDRGVGDDTLILVTSDNGSRDGPRGVLRGVKSSLFEHGVRVPLVARWPAAVPAGVTNDSILASVDLLPTLLELAGDTGGTTDGVSFAAPLKSGETRERPAPLFWQKHDGHALRDGRWKLVNDGDRTYLFDLVADPGESRNERGRHAEVAADVDERHLRWRLQASRIPFQVQEIRGAARVDGERLTLTGAGDAVRLVFDRRFDVNDGSFTLSVHVALEETGRRQVLAAQRGVWLLIVDPRGRLQLVLEEDAGDARRTLRSSAQLLAGREHHVAFTISGTRKLGRAARLYVDGRLQDASKDLPALGVSEAPVEVGRAGNSPTGTLDRLSFHTLGLEVADLKRLAAMR